MEVFLLTFLSFSECFFLFVFVVTFSFHLGLTVVLSAIIGVFYQGWKIRERLTALEIVVQKEKEMKEKEMKEMKEMTEKKQKQNDEKMKELKEKDLCDLKDGLKRIENVVFRVQ